MSKVVKMVFIILLFVTFILFFGCADADLNVQPKKANISVIVKKQGPGYWTTVKMGAQAAAKEFNVKMSFTAPVNEQDIDVQIELAEKAIKNSDALVLAACDYNALVPVVERAKKAGIPVIIIDSALNSDNIDSFVGTNNIDTGRKLGESLVNKVGDKCSVIIMSFVKGAATANQREIGFREVVSTYPYIEILDTLYCNSDEAIAEDLAKQAIQSYPQIDAFVCFNDFGTLGTARAIDRLDLAGNIKIIGFEGTQAQVTYMEKDVIQSLVVQNPFSIGYLGVKYAFDRINNKLVPKNFDTGSTVIDINNMYLPENQKLVFPFTD